MRDWWAGHRYHCGLTGRVHQVFVLQSLSVAEIWTTKCFILCRHIKNLYTEENKLFVHIGLGAAALFALSFAIYRFVRAVRWERSRSSWSWHVSQACQCLCVPWSITVPSFCTNLVWPMPADFKNGRQTTTAKQNKMVGKKIEESETVLYWATWHDHTETVKLYEAERV